MLFYVFAKSELETLFELLSYNAIIGPTRKGQDIHGQGLYDFAYLEDYSALALDYPTTIHSAKWFFFPHVQTLASYIVEGDSWTEDSKRSSTVTTVLFGLHACDINALNKLDLILLRGPAPLNPYHERRRSSFVIGTSCTPQPYCFCKSMGCDSILHGCDMFLTDLGDVYFCEIRSGTAFELMRAIDSRQADHRIHARYIEHEAARKQRFSCHLDTTDLTRILDMEFESDAWEHWGKRCLSCGTCASVCPTCYCYGIEHHISPDLRGAQKVRRLYSCNLVDFAEIAGGYNFRPDGGSRIKYRYYHKHRGFVEAFEEPLCVGCGRCGKSCLADITVPDVIASIQKEVSNGG